MAKSPKRSGAKRPPAPTRRSHLAQPLLDAVGDPSSTGGAQGDLDVAPLLVALKIGALDEHLEQIGRIVNDRIAALNALDELIASAKLHVGDKVRLGHNLRPNYLHGRAATIMAKDGEKWIVRLDEPVQGKYANGDFRLSAIQLEPINGGE